MMNNPFKIIIAGGKTGGHLFPGIAVTQALQRHHDNVMPLFVGTNAPFETQTLEKYGYIHESIFSKPIKGGNFINKAISISLVLISLIQSLFIIWRFKPDFVLGVGGFSSFAVVLAAWICRIPTAIQEQNAFPGMTNRLLSRIADTIFTSFEETKGLTHNKKVRALGNPVRKIEKSVLETDFLMDGFQSDKPTILVTGGSQGAHSINTAFFDAVALMDNPDKFNIIHQTGIKDEMIFKEKYRNLNIKATAKAFFHNMPDLLTIADIAITRAGAGTISELCINSLPAILVPFPHAADDHQTFNAKALEDNKAAVLINDTELNGPILKRTLENLLENTDKLAHMKDRLKELARPDADEKIAITILKTKGSKG